MNRARLAAITLVDAVAGAGRLSMNEVRQLIPDGLALDKALLDLSQRSVPVTRAGDELRWTPAPGGLCPALIEQEVRSAGQRCAVSTLALTDSTSSRLLADAAAGNRSPRALIAECQMDGRGRRERSWHCAYGAGILLSLLVDTGRRSAELPGVAIAAGVAMAASLADLGVAGVTVKWPNDLLLDGAKLAGLLVESPGGAAAQGVVVIGLGLNWTAAIDHGQHIDQSTADLLPSLPRGMVDRSIVAGRLVAALMAMVDRFRADGLAPFLADFARFDALKGHAVTVTTGSETQAGIALGIADDGSLRVAHADGERRHRSADVSVRAT